jgi:hypothetical protein
VFHWRRCCRTGVDQAGHYQEALGVEQFGARRIEARTHAYQATVLDEDIQHFITAGVRVEHATLANQQMRFRCGHG